MIKRIVLSAALFSCLAGLAAYAASQPPAVEYGRAPFDAENPQQGFGGGMQAVEQSPMAAPAGAPVQTDDTTFAEAVSMETQGHAGIQQWVKDTLDNTVSGSGIHKRLIGREAYYEQNDGKMKYVISGQSDCQYAYQTGSGKILGVAVPLSEGLETDSYDIRPEDLEALLGAEKMEVLQLQCEKEGKRLPNIAPGADAGMVYRYVLADGYTVEVAAGGGAEFSEDSCCLIYKTDAFYTGKWYAR